MKCSRNYIIEYIYRKGKETCFILMFNTKYKGLKFIVLFLIIFEYVYYVKCI